MSSSSVLSVFSNAWAVRWHLALLAGALSLAGPAAGQGQLQRNPMPKNYHGPQPGVAQALPTGMVRVHLRIVDAEGQPLHRALVRVEGAPQQLLSDSAGTISLLVNLANGPLHLACTCFGYGEGHLSIERPEDNNLVFQLFRSKEVVSAQRAQ